jgi:hypothetical protein
LPSLFLEDLEDLEPKSMDYSPFSLCFSPNDIFSLCFSLEGTFLLLRDSLSDIFVLLDPNEEPSSHTN